MAGFGASRYFIVSPICAASLADMADIFDAVYTGCRVV